MRDRIALVALLFAAFTVPSATLSAQTITLNASQRFQTISGWEGTSEAGQMECSTFDRYKGEMIDRLVNELGLNRIRLEIRSGVEHSTNFTKQFFDGQISLAQWKQNRYSTVNDNADPFVINPSGFHFTEMDQAIEELVLPMRQHLQAMGEELYVNVNYVHFKSEDYIHLDPEEYAEFVLATYQHIEQKYGFVPDSWEVVLEPEHNLWTGTTIGEAIVASAARLSAHGYTPNFVAPSVTNMSNFPTYFNAMKAVPGALQHVGLLSYHRYQGPTLEKMQVIAQIAQQHQKPVAMLEGIGSTYATLHEDLQYGNNVAWQQYGLGFCNGETGGDYYWADESNPQNPVVHIDNDSRFFRQYFRYIRRGAVRIGASTGDGILAPLAFVHPDGRYVVVVKTTGKRDFTVQGLPSGQYGIRYTTDTQTHVDGGNVTLSSGQALSASIPGRGVITIFAKSGGGTPPPPPPSSPDLSLSKTSLSFGDVTVGDTKQLTFAIDNDGTSTLNVTSIASSTNEYSVNPTSGNVAAGGTMTVSVTFAPDGAGSAPANLTIQSNDDASPHQVSLSGNGVGQGEPVLSISTSEIEFGAVPVGSEAERMFTIQNEGNAPLRISSIETHAPAVTVEPEAATLDAGESLEVHVVFAPTVEGSLTATLTVVSEAENSPHEIVLRGEADQATGSNDENVREGEVYLESYPNPFDDIATVAYYLPDAEYVELTAYDQLGRQIASLVDGFRPAGRHEVEVDASDWASGVYLCVLTVDGSTLTRAMIRL